MSLVYFLHNNLRTVKLLFSPMYTYNSKTGVQKAYRAAARNMVTCNMVTCRLLQWLGT